jgi:hypothetical protein
MQYKAEVLQGWIQYKAEVLQGWRQYRARLERVKAANTLSDLHTLCLFRPRSALRAHVYTDAHTVPTH